MLTYSSMIQKFTAFVNANGGVAGNFGSSVNRLADANKIYCKKYTTVQNPSLFAVEGHILFMWIFGV